MLYTNVGRAVVGKDYYKGLEDVIRIQGYCEEFTEEEKYDFRGAQISLDYGEKCKRLHAIILDMLAFAQSIRGARVVNILVAAKDIQGVDTDLFSVMEGLRRRGRKVSFVVPDDASESDFPPRDSASLVWRWTSLFDGDSPTVINTDLVGTSQGPKNRRKGVRKELPKRVKDPFW
ncbi:unnamed protein product [Microthlaspi erraticum]|uniref:NYN domain-containing protein n=1 Tax=Microthlaspi erraticum TaxID=1685480 RepID=A0A6D2IVR7_9BRAS|nr:unnamed protein product [Microthlaspi erraticum]